MTNLIDYSNSRLEKVSVHGIGNITSDEELYISKSLLDISDSQVKELLFKFFTNPFQSPEFYNFTFSNDDFTLNPMFVFASNIFDSAKTFHKNSVNIAKHLYELSTHPQIKSGDLFIAYLTDVRIEDEMIDAIGIFKSENKQDFIKLNSQQNEYSVITDSGINIDKLDKGCFIFDIDKELGYRICIVDKSNKAAEAQYWRDNFLQIKECSDDYHQTRELMILAKKYVTKQITEEFEISKTDQIDLLNRSVDYFKTHETFEKKEFEKQVFQNKDIIKSFRNFDGKYRENNDINISDTFDISQQAVKKQSKVFKSILKLDNNFHIYIHGNKELIEQGTDRDGRKFYKIYFETET
ncbi:MAG: nucleoid-associated protein [Candidatus Kapabacteria bacterium]|nr:nucleoid-associated protein [Candidatus Kapabacteria bacterium]